MDKLTYIDTVYQETMGAHGFLSKLRENTLDEDGYQRLLDAVNSLTPFYQNENDIDKLLVACLYEVPWEIDNCVDHYSMTAPKLGERVSSMSESLRAAINDLLWSGLEEHYENI